MTTPVPTRRSSRKATVHATQVSEGTLRPFGPPHLEAALNIALDNLHSETWGYLAYFVERNKGQPLPTTAEIKLASASVRRAAAAVDKAERILEEAIDKVVKENIQRRRRGVVVGSKYVEQNKSDPSTRETTPAIEHRG